MARCKHGECEMCGREKDLTFHHLIPRTLHKNKWFKKNFSREEMDNGIDICQDCHSAVHDFIDEKQLGREFNTLEKLMEHEKVDDFVEWVSKR